MTDLVSVIVLVYQVEKYLDQCIQSICMQTYKNLEIVLVDDGSGDICAQICERYARLDSRVKVVHCDGGVDAARKVGISAAKGKYVGYVDGDDWIEPDMYEKLVAYAHLYDVDVVESGAVDSWTDVEKNRVPFLPEGCYKGENFVKNIEPKLLYAGTFFQHGISPYLWSKLFRKDKFEKYQMMPGMLNEYHDSPMVSLPCIAETKSLYISHDCFYHYRVRADSGKREVRKNEILNFTKYYQDAFLRFKGTLLDTRDDRQIQYYLMYWLILKAPEIFDTPGAENFLVPYGNIGLHDKIVLYGAGAAGIHMEHYIRNVKGSNLTGWIDKNFLTLQNSLGVQNPEEITNMDYDHIIISILREDAVESAKEDLKALGIPEYKTLWIEQKYIENPALLLEKATYNGERIFRPSDFNKPV